jgi:threonine dehydrogenase-like Zn-dependent dehydrogenase
LGSYLRAGDYWSACDSDREEDPQGKGDCYRHKGEPSWENRLELARIFGADYTFNVNTSDPVDEIIHLTGGGVDYTYEAAGNPEALQQAIHITRKSGSIVVMTVHREIQIDLEYAIRNELTLHGSICYNYKEFDYALELIAKGKIDVESFLGHTFPLKEAEKAFQFGLASKAVKVILKP